MKTCEVDGCNKKLAARGMCAMHYRRWKLYGDPDAVILKQQHGLSLEERFLVYAGTPPDMSDKDACWEWTGYKDPNGYGRLRVSDRPILAHRLSWTFFKGELSDDEHVLHHCDNPSCIRPSHLFKGTHQDNMDDMWSKGRGNPGKSVGEKHGCSKLTEAEVLAIRSSEETGVALARKYGISTTNICDIRNRRIWTHI